MVSLLSESNKSDASMNSANYNCNANASMNSNSHMSVESSISMQMTVMHLDTNSMYSTKSNSH